VVQSYYLMFDIFWLARSSADLWRLLGLAG
jgi:hypothetical protein